MKLEKIVIKEMKVKGLQRVMVSSDWHVPYVNDNAFKLHLQYAKNYKPHKYVLNGDLIDFYTLSVFDKNPENRTSVQDELDMASKYLIDLKRALPKSTKIYYLEGNHETRLQKWLWKNKEVSSLRSMKLENQLSLKEKGIKLVSASHDYWKTDNGHLKIGDVLIMHGDNRINGASSSKYSGYSAKNTMQTMMSSVAIGHGHRLASINQRTPNGFLYGLETGCLCQLSGTANWQNGFATFEVNKGKSVNHRTYHINNNQLIVDSKKYGFYKK